MAGDRRVDLSALRHGRWDAVVDTCGYLPAEVAATAELLRDRVGRYVFVSSVSAYAGSATPNHEDSPLAHTDQPDTQVVDANTYGPLKALCEQALFDRLGARSLLLRPGLIVGPHDPTGRFTWWPVRVARAADGDAVLAPGTPADPLQFIDARDLAAFMLHALANDLGGAYNLVAPAAHWTFGELLDTCARVAGCAPRWVWADAAWLEAQQVGPWMELPLWLPADAQHAAFMHTDASRAMAAGLTIRPLADTVADTLAWWRALPATAQGFTQTGLAPEREQTLLAALGH